MCACAWQKNNHKFHKNLLDIITFFSFQKISSSIMVTTFVQKLMTLFWMSMIASHIYVGKVFETDVVGVLMMFLKHAGDLTTSLMFSEPKQAYVVRIRTKMFYASYLRRVGVQRIKSPALSRRSSSGSSHRSAIWMD